MDFAHSFVRFDTFELPSTATTNRVHPWRVGVVVDKAFMPYKITFRYWSSTPFSWSLHGLPDALVKTLRPHFASVEPLEVDQRISPQRHDLIARMTVDQLHFDGANTTGRRDRVDLTMTFVVEQPNGREVFRTTVAANASSPYRQPCRTGFCQPNPREAFMDVFTAVFSQLSQTLNGFDFSR